MKVSVVENINQKINNKSLVYLKTQISSDFFSKCNEKNLAKKCTQLENSNNRAYSLSELIKISPDFINIFNDTKIKSLNVNTFRFLPQLTDSFYSIAEKYIDTDESSSSEFYLIKIKPDLKVEKIGDYYSIDSSGVITYKDENFENISNIFLLHKCQSISHKEDIQRVNISPISFKNVNKK
ncbi:hypothetical protein NGB32_04925 [Acinetobacter pittii]|nr:hypothetical protein [Acinetobacter pittii]MEB7640487.1 hypothetical protein [Acinetobacter pittii]